MNKAVLISIRPKWCELIASGKKTVEVRKTKPNAILPLRCYIYETRGDERGNGRGKVIGEFVCHNIFPLLFYASDASFFDTAPPMSVPGTCLTDKEIVDYLGNGKTGYGWLISNLVIYDTPKELSEFRGICSKVYCQDTCDKFKKHICSPSNGGKYMITRPPQSWMYVED